MKSAGLCCLAVVALLGGAGCSKSPFQKATVYVDPALMSLVPADTRLLVGANLETLRKSRIYEQHFANEFAAQLDLFTRRTGLDPRKDIWEILACSDGKNQVIMARGRFSLPDLEPEMDKQGAQKTKYKNYTLYGDERTAGVFLNSSTAIAGNTAAVKAIIDARDRPAAPPAALVQLAEQIPHGTQLWAVFTGNFLQLPQLEGGNLANVNRILGSLENGKVYMNVSSGMDVFAGGTAVDEKNAQEIGDALRALLGLLRLNTRTEQKELFEIYDAVDIKQSAMKVQLSAHFKEELVERVYQFLVSGGLTSSRGSRPPGSSNPRPR